MLSESRTLSVPPPFPSDFLPRSSPLVCNNIFNFTRRPREEFLVFGEPESLQCDFRHSGQRSLITLQWRRPCVCVCVCAHVFAYVCWKWFCFPSHACSSANKSYLFVWKWYWKCQRCEGICVFCCSSSLCWLFPIAQIWALACRFLQGAMTACRWYGGTKGGWLCGPRATASHFLLASLRRNILLEFLLGLEWSPSVEGLLLYLPRVAVDCEWGGVYIER